MKSRVELFDRDLAARLEGASSKQLRDLALAVCRTAAKRTDLTGDVVAEALRTLENGQYGDASLRSDLEMLVQKLDELQWSVQEAAEKGEATEAQYAAAFCRARAANALYFACDSDPFVAATESLYEARAAVDLDMTRLRDILHSILD